MLQVTEIIHALEIRRMELERAIELAHKIHNKMPNGRLRISHNKGVAQYYRVTDNGDISGQYIRKRNKELIRKLAQKDYAEKLQKNALEELKEIKSIIEKLENVIIPGDSTNSSDYLSNTIYSALSEERRELVSPILVDDREFAARWEAEEYRKNEYKSEEKIYPTKKGEMVRSKSEVMLADMYYELGIPYRYEAELRLGNSKTTYPDFTILDVSKRQEIYHEHMGLLDDEEYRYHNLRKIEEYRKNNIFMGKNLIITHESSGCPLNIREIEKSTKWLLGIKMNNS